MVVTRGKGVREIIKRGKGVKYIVVEEGLTLGGEHAMRYANDYHRIVHLKPIQSY